MSSCDQSPELRAKGPSPANARCRRDAPRRSQAAAAPVSGLVSITFALSRPAATRFTTTSARSKSSSLSAGAGASRSTTTCGAIAERRRWVPRWSRDGAKWHPRLATPSASDRRRSSTEFVLLLQLNDVYWAQQGRTASTSAPRGGGAAHLLPRSVPLADDTVDLRGVSDTCGGSRTGLMRDRREGEIRTPDLAVPNRAL